MYVSEQDGPVAKPSENPKADALRRVLRGINKQLQILESRKQAIIQEIKQMEVQ